VWTDGVLKNPAKPRKKKFLAQKEGWSQRNLTEIGVKSETKRLKRTRKRCPGVRKGGKLGKKTDSFQEGGRR